ncbi:MAG: hypothetical protein KIC65_09685 [Firmicutes bacterium]|nr:hypothetical protein [Bacillota bacterium]
MSVGSKNILNFETTGNAGDIVFSYDDLTIEHPEFMKLDGSIYKKAQYPQIEKFFNYASVNPLETIIPISETVVTKATGTKEMQFFFAEGDDVTFVFVSEKTSGASYGYITTLVSHDRGETFEINKYTTQVRFRPGLRTGVAVKNGNVIYIVYRDTTTALADVYIEVMYTYDLGKTWKYENLNRSDKSTKYDVSLLTSNGRAYMRYQSGSDHIFLTKLLDENTTGGNGWEQIDISNIANDSLFYRIANSDKLILGGISNGTFRIINGDGTYTDHPTHSFSVSKFDHSKIFYKNGLYLFVYPQYNSADGRLYSTADFNNWGEEVMAAPEFGNDDSSYNVYACDYKDYSIFKGDGGVSILLRDVDNYSKRGASAALYRSGFSGIGILNKVYTEKETGRDYLISFEKLVEDTKVTYYTLKCYLKDPKDYFKISSSYLNSKITGCSSDQYPFIRAE